MRNTKRSIQTAITIDDFPLVWRLHREQQWSDANELRGISIHVKRALGVFRELVLEYPPVRAQKAGLLRADPGRPTIVADRIKAHIQDAIASGWDPGSRGKPFFYYPEDAPG
jgi:hypothetical protein